MVNTLNTYFSSVFTQEQLNTFYGFQIRRQTLDTFNFRLEDGQEKLNHLNVYNSTGPDLLYPRVLRTLEDLLCRPLNHIFNKSAGTGIIPADRKPINVTAIHKKGNRQEPGNYRPICLTYVVCKTMERLIKVKIITHLEGNNLICDSQHGFRNKRSYLTSQLDFFTHVIDTYDEGNIKAVDPIYQDFQKTFDKVAHERLLVKVMAYGIHGSAAQWIRNW